MWEYAILSNINSCFMALVTCICFKNKMLKIFFSTNQKGKSHAMTSKASGCDFSKCAVILSPPSVSTSV